MEKNGNNISSDLVAGRNPVIELLKSGRETDKLFVQKGSREGSMSLIIAEAKRRSIPIVETEKAKLDAMTGGMSHQGVVAAASQITYSTVEDILSYAAERNEAPFIIIADGVEDPHNLGALIRTAECAGAHGLIIPKRRSAAMSAATAKSAAGALEYVKVARVPNLVQVIKTLKDAGVWIYSADMDGSPYTEVDLKGSCALVLGGEGGGVSQLVRKESDFILSIPMYGNVNSLNVSNAGAVLMYEVVRQRSAKRT